MPSALAPRYWGGHVVVLVLMAAAVLLGIWQLGVWEDHRTAASTDRTHATPVPLAKAIGTDEAFPSDAVGRPVELGGTWLSDDAVLISGREQGGATGYWMVVPLTVDGTDSAMPVVLGWLADVGDQPPAPQGHADLTAWLQPSMADDGTASGAGDVLSTLQTSELTQLVDQDLYDGYAVAKGGQAGLAQAELPKLPDAGWSTSVRNLLYGLQWWVFGAFAVLMWWRWLTERLAADRHHPTSTVTA